MSIQYYLLPNTATADPNDCYALVVTRDNLDNDALAQELVQRGAATSKAQALGVLNACQEIIAQKVAEGYAINTPLFTARPGINGVFTNPTDTFDPARHTIVGNLSGGPLLREQLGGASTEKILRPAPAPALTAFTNKSTGAVNTIATPGAIGQITGEQLKFDPAKTADGIYFVPGTGSAVKVATASIANRTEGTLLFTIPALAAGTYTLQVRRTYGTGANLQVRTGQLGATLTVA